MAWTKTDVAPGRQRGRRPRLLFAVLSAWVLSTCCGPASVPRYTLETVEEPFVEYEPRSLDEDDSVQWLDDGRLFIETNSVYGQYRQVKQVWITFEPAAPALVEVRSWGEERFLWGATWPRRDIRGSAWVSSDGSDLSRADGPGLTVQARWRCRMAGSDKRGSLHLHLPPDLLLR